NSTRLRILKFTIILLWMLMGLIWAVRYNESGSILSKQFFYLYCILCTAIRLRILVHLPNKSNVNYGLGKIGLEEIPQERCDSYRILAKELVLDCS
ncbi:MAG TPA: hypothetical protein VKY57_01400, partial [Chitinispirillaceae bacterium]|nr:hypothetical protein [Chitinispirillaceae bacterium]